MKLNNPFEDFPEELSVYILSFLKPSELAVISRVSNFFNRITTSVKIEKIKEILSNRDFYLHGDIKSCIQFLIKNNKKLDAFVLFSTIYEAEKNSAEKEKNLNFIAKCDQLLLDNFKIAWLYVRTVPDSFQEDVNEKKAAFFCAVRYCLSIIASDESSNEESKLLFDYFKIKNLINSHCTYQNFKSEIKENCKRMLSGMKISEQDELLKTAEDIFKKINYEAKPNASPQLC